MLCYLFSLQAYPQFVLTYLEELNAQVDVTQAEYHIHHGSWSTDYQEHGSSFAEEVSVMSYRQDKTRPLKCLWKRVKCSGCFQEARKETLFNVTDYL